MARTIYANSKIDRNAFSVGSFDEPSDEKNYWLARTPSDRLKQIEILRRINYEHRATVRLQRVFKIASGKPELFLQKIKSFVWDIRQCALRFQQAYQEWNLRNAMPAGSEI